MRFCYSTYCYSCQSAYEDPYQGSAVCRTEACECVVSLGLSFATPLNDVLRNGNCNTLRIAANLVTHIRTLQQAGRMIMQQHLRLPRPTRRGARRSRILSSPAPYLYSTIKVSYRRIVRQRVCYMGVPLSYLVASTSRILGKSLCRRYDPARAHNHHW